jgi:transcriptional regulator
VLIHPWDAALDDAEWQRWLADGRDFGQLVVNGPAGRPPIALPTHFCVDGAVLLVHLARPNPVWPALLAGPVVLFSVVDDDAYVPSTWRARAGGPDEDGVPTSYYAAVQLTCRAEVVDDPEGKAELLRRQLAHFQPAGDHAAVAVGQPPYGRMLAGIRGLRLHVQSVAAKFKYDDHNPQAHRVSVAERLDERGRGRDAGAAAQQRRRLEQPGAWRPAPRPRA